MGSLFGKLRNQEVGVMVGARTVEKDANVETGEIWGKKMTTKSSVQIRPM